MSISDIVKGSDIHRDDVIAAIREEINVAAATDFVTGWKLYDDGGANVSASYTAGVVFSDDAGTGAYGSRSSFDTWLTYLLTNNTFPDTDSFRHVIDKSRISGATITTVDFERFNYISGTEDVSVDNIIDTLLANAFLCTQIRRVKWKFIFDSNAGVNGEDDTDPIYARLDIADQLWYNEWDDIGRRYGLGSDTVTLSADIVAQDSDFGYINPEAGGPLNAVHSGIPALNTEGVPVQHVSNISYNSTLKLLQVTAVPPIGLDISGGTTVTVGDFVKISDKRPIADDVDSMMTLIQVDSQGKEVYSLSNAPLYYGYISVFKDKPQLPGLFNMIQEVSTLLKWHRDNAAVIDIYNCHSNCHSNCHGSRNRR